MRDPSNSYTFAANDNGRNASASLNSATVGSYLYNAFEQRAQKIAGTTTTQFVYDRAGHLLEEANASGVVQKEYIWLDDLPVAMVDDTGSSPVLYFIHTDQLGTPQKITDGSASIVWDGVFDPFGNMIAANGSNWGTGVWGSFNWAAASPLAGSTNLRFPGQYADAETALNQNWNRDYDPTIGRYVQSDPIGLDGGINTYSYVDGNPIILADLAGTGPAGCIIGGIIGGTIGEVATPAGAIAGAEEGCELGSGAETAIELAKAAQATSGGNNGDECDRRCEKAKNDARSAFSNLVNKRIPQYLSGGTRGHDVGHYNAAIGKQRALKDAIRRVKLYCNPLPPELPMWEGVANQVIPILH